MIITIEYYKNDKYFKHKYNKKYINKTIIDFVKEHFAKNNCNIFFKITYKKK